jgi:hypothetical protein
MSLYIKCYGSPILQLLRAETHFETAVGLSLRQTDRINERIADINVTNRQRNVYIDSKLNNPYVYIHILQVDRHTHYVAALDMQARMSSYHHSLSSAFPLPQARYSLRLTEINDSVK